MQNLDKRPDLDKRLVFRCPIPALTVPDQCDVMTPPIERRVVPERVVTYTQDWSVTPTYPL